MLIAALVFTSQPVEMSSRILLIFILTPHKFNCQTHKAIIGSPALCASEPAIDDSAKS